MSFANQIQERLHMCNKPIRILQVIGSLEAGGSQSMIMNIYRNINRNEIQFDFVIDHTGENFYENEIRNLGGKIYIMPTYKVYNHFFVKRAWYIFFKTHPEYKILHSHVRSYAVVYINIAKKFGIKTIIHSHSTSNGTGIKSAIKKLLQYPLRTHADYLLACSNNAGEWLYGKKACNQDNFLVIPNAVDIPKYKFNAETRNKYRKELGIESRYVIGHIGRFHQAKNHLFLLDVFKKIYEKNKNAVLLLIGDGELRQQIERRISELRLDDCVILTGNRNDVANLFQAMDIFAFPSLWEGLPVTVVEAQAAGLPCVISDRITDEVNLSKLVVKLAPDDPEKWCDELLKKHKHIDASAEISKAGFDIKTSASELCALYKNIGRFAYE